MQKIEDALWQDYDDADEMLDDLAIESENYGKIMEEKDKIRKELIEVGQIRQETDIKMAQIESENNREKHRNWINVGTFLVTTLVSAGTVILSFSFDTENSLTSTIGKGFVNGVVNKLKNVR